MARTRAALEAEKKSFPPLRHTSSSQPISPIVSPQIAESTSQTTQLDDHPSTKALALAHDETTQPAQARSWTKRPEWEAFSRYLSQNTSSFPDYGAPQVPMRILKSLNASMGGPVNTMSGKPRTAPRSSAHSSSQPTSRSKRPRDLPSSPVSDAVVTSPEPLNHGVADRGTEILVMKPHRPSGNVAQNTYSKRRVRSSKPPYLPPVDHQRKRDRALMIDSVDDDAVGSSRPIKDHNRQKRNTSPDVIAVDDPAEDDPPPANVISDLITAKRPRPAQLVSQRPEKRVKKTKAGSPEEPDELQIVAARAPTTRAKRAKHVDDAQGDDHPKSYTTSSYFTSPPQQTRDPNAFSIKVTKAAAGNKYYMEDHDQRGPVFLRAASSMPWVLRAVDRNERNIKDLEWMDIDLRAVQTLLYSDSSHIQVRRPLTQNRPSSIVFQFDSSADSQRLVSHEQLSPGTANLRTPLVMKNIFKTSIREAASRHSGQKDGEPSRPRSQSLGQQPHGRRSASPRVTSNIGIKHREEPSSNARDDPAPNGSLYRMTRRSSDAHSVESQGLQPGHTRQSTPPLLVDEHIIRWTDHNREWAQGWQQSLIYPPIGKNRTTVDKDDIPRLDEGEFLNDNLINFWIRYLQHKLETDDPAMLKRVYFFSTFFFEKLKYNNGKIDYDGVKGWTSKVDIFSYDYLVVPVNENAHWYLAIVCNPGMLLPQGSGLNKMAEVPSPTHTKVATIGRRLSEVSLAEAAKGTQASLSAQGTPKFAGSTVQDRSSKGTDANTGNSKTKQDSGRPRIVTLDSLGSAHPKTCGALRMYLVAEANDKKKVRGITPPPGFTAKSIPQQDNWCDCGIYVLVYVEQFLQAPDESLQRILQKEPTGWKVRAQEKRKSIRQLILMLQKRQQEDAGREKEAKLARRRAKAKAREAANSTSVLREVENATPVSKEGINNHSSCQSDAKDALCLTPGSLPERNVPLAVSEPASLGVTPERDASKGASSSNSFHTANSSPAYVTTAESSSQATEGDFDKDKGVGEINSDPTPGRQEDVILIEGLPSSPQPSIRDIQPSEPRKRKRPQGTERSPGTPGRRRKLVEQMADSRNMPKESIEVDDDDSIQSESGAKYDGIDWTGRAD